MHCTLFKCLNPFFPDSVVWIWADKPPTGLLSLSEWLIRLTRKREKLFSWSAMWVAWHTHETQTQATFCKITFLFLFTSKYFGMYNSFVWGSWATYSTPETTEDQSWEKKTNPITHFICFYSLQFHQLKFNTDPSVGWQLMPSFA